MDIGLIAPALIGGVMVIVGAIIVAWMNAHKPTLEMPASDDRQLDIPFDLDKAGKKSNYTFVYQTENRVDH